MVQLPKGRYVFLVVCGDMLEEADTTVTFGPDFIKRRAGTWAGAYSALTFALFHQEDGAVSIGFDTQPSCFWKVNMIIVKKLAALM